jgi:argininosuccinate synthase
MLQAAIGRQGECPGSVTLKLYKGMSSSPAVSPYALYSAAHVTSRRCRAYDQKDAEGFIRPTRSPCGCWARPRR